MVDARKRGNGRRYYFRKLEDAQQCANQLAIQRENLGLAVLNLDARDMVAAIECQQLLAPWGKSIRDATEHLLTHLVAEDRRSALTVAEAVGQYLVVRQADVKRDELAERSLVQLQHRLRRLVTLAGDQRVGDFNQDAVVAFLDTFRVTSRTRNNIRLRLSSFFSFCKSKGWVGSNPCAEIKIKLSRHDVVVLSVDDAERLLRASEALNLVPYVATCLFAGLRPFECRQLDWRDIDIQTTSIFVRAETSKKRESRYVQLEPILLEWLWPHARPRGPIVGTNFRKRWDRLLQASGYGPKKKWPQDSMRHSYASYWLAMHQDRAKLVELMGTSVEVLRRHYRQPIPITEARRFWALSPNAAANGERESSGTGQAQTRE